MIGRSGAGIRFFYDGAEIGSLVGVTFDGETRSTFDSTSYKEEAAPGQPAYKVFGASEFVDPGGCTLSVLLDPDVTFAYSRGGEPLPFVVRFKPRGTQIKGAELTTLAHVTTLGRATPMEDRMTQDIGFKFSGPLTVVPGSDIVVAIP